VLLNDGFYIRKIPIEKIIEKITKNPAEQFGVYPQKGSMLTGSDADITIIDMDKSKKVTARDLHSRSDFSLYEGKVLHGWPVITIKSGKIVYQDEKFTGEKAQCNYLKR
jgi:dihydropyrimidinase